MEEQTNQSNQLNQTNQTFKGLFPKKEKGGSRDFGSFESSNALEILKMEKELNENEPKKPKYFAFGNGNINDINDNINNIEIIPSNENSKLEDGLDDLLSTSKNENIISENSNQILENSNSQMNEDSRDSLLSQSSDSVKTFSVGKKFSRPQWKKTISKGTSEYVPYPLKNKKFLKNYKDARSVFWTEDSIDLSQDSDDYDKLSEPKKNLLKLVLAFFARTDALVNDNIVLNLYPKVIIPEIRLFYAFQIYIESIHAVTYAKIIFSLIKDKKERDQLLKNVDKYKSVGRKEAWIKNWIDDTPSFAESIIAFICVEGIFFSASFAVLYWFQHTEKGKFPGIMLSNRFISRDEATHADENVLTYLALADNEKLKEERIYEIFRTAVECEKDFTKESLPTPLSGISSKSMSQYVEYVADFWLHELGLKPLYKTKNPYEWMDLLELKSRGNFFEHRNHDYVSDVKSGSLGNSSSNIEELRKLRTENEKLRAEIAKLRGV